jgi:carbamoyltransferase
VTRQKPIYVLGTGLSHDGSSCLLKDGRICVAIEKERITRKKHDGGNDASTVQYCLDAEGIRLSDLSLIVQNANFGMFEFGNDWFLGKRLVEDEIPVVTISHHLAHAYSAYGTSPFRDSAVLVIDGCGNGFDECMDLKGAFIPEIPTGEIASLWFEKDSYYKVEDGILEAVCKDFSPFGMGLKNYPMYPGTTRHSIGGLYAGVSRYVFGGMDDSGKLMGLAPYGCPGVYDFEVFELREGRVFVRYEWMAQFRQPCRSEEQFKANFQQYADLAYWIQREVERAILYTVRSRFELCQSPRLCYSGGVALNAVANRRILTETPFEQVYIQPAAGDNGLAIGCAYYGWMEVLKREKVQHDGSTHFGRVARSDEVELAFKACGDCIEVEDVEDFVEATAVELSSGKVVGWFQGKSEFGPRALGYRSILADPRLPEIGQYINREVKFREDFRPFAPSVPVEDVNIYFDCNYQSPYMLLVGTVRPEWRSLIPSVVHKDYSARIQTVEERLSPTYHRLLRAFQRHTGISVLLNTSFNRRRMPIVETPQQAIEFFLACGIHVLVVDRYLVRKIKPRSENSSISNLFSTQMHQSLQLNLEQAVQLGGIYQFNIGTMQTFTIDLTNGAVQVQEGKPSRKPDVLIETGESELQQVLAAPEGIGHYMSSGKVRISGDANRAYTLAMLLKQ